MSNPVMLGVDPGLANWGYAVAEVSVEEKKIKRVLELGVVRTKKDKSLGLRIGSDRLIRARNVVQQMHSIIEKHDIKVVASETLGPTAQPGLAFGFGMMMGMLASFDCILIELHPLQIKKEATGIGNASKLQMIEWGIDLTKSDDVAWPTSNQYNAYNLDWRGKHVMLNAHHQADALGAIYAGLQLIF